MTELFFYISIFRIFFIRQTYDQNSPRKPFFRSTGNIFKMTQYSNFVVIRSSGCTVHWPILLMLRYFWKGANILVEAMPRRQKPFARDQCRSTLKFPFFVQSCLPWPCSKSCTSTANNSWSTFSSIPLPTMHIIQITKLFVQNFSTSNLWLFKYNIALLKK